MTGLGSFQPMAVVFPAVSAGVVSALSVLVSGAAWRALLRHGNPVVGYVVAAFLVLGVKNLAKLLLLLGPGSVPFAWEIAFSLADVAVVGLVAWPLLLPRRRGGA